MLDSLQPNEIVTAKVFINDVELSGEIQLQHFSVSIAFNKIASAKLSFLDGSVADQDFPLSNDDKFKPGSKVKVQLGHEGTADTVFEGIIVKHSIKVRADRSPELHLEAKDKAIKLTGARKSAYYIQKTDSDVMQQLAGDLQIEVDSTTFQHKQLVQFDVTDWDFIVIRAEAAGMLVLTDNGKLVIKKPMIGVPVTTAGLGDNVRDFEAEIDARNQPASITSQSWDYTKQQIETSGAGAATFTETGNLSSDELGTVINAQKVLSHTGHLTQDQLQNWTDAYDLRRHLSKVAGRLKLDGNSTVKPGATMALAGFGNRFNGNVYITGVQHTYNGMWHTDVQFGWRDEWFYKKDDVMDKPAKGLLAGINGLQIGIVTDLDDQDEGGQYRVKVKMPMVGEDEGVWARVATLDAGDQHGSYFRPQLGDEAVLGFLNDDPRDAVILGYLHSKDSNQSPLPADANTLQYGFITKEGIKVILDDTNKSMKLIVTTGSGEKSIVINDSSGAMELKDENNNSIKMEPSGITIQAGAGNVTIKGTQVLIN